MHDIIIIIIKDLLGGSGQDYQRFLLTGASSLLLSAFPFHSTQFNNNKTETDMSGNERPIIHLVTGSDKGVTESLGRS